MYVCLTNDKKGEALFIRGASDLEAEVCEQKCSA